MPLLGEKQGLLGSKEKFFIRNAGTESKPFDIKGNKFYSSPDVVSSMKEKFAQELKDIESDKDEFWDQVSEYTGKTVKQDMVDSYNKAISDLDSIKSDGELELSSLPGLAAVLRMKNNVSMGSKGLDVDLNKAYRKMAEFNSIAPDNAKSKSVESFEETSGQDYATNQNSYGDN